MEISFWSGLLIVFNVILVFVLIRRRRRRKGEPPIVAHRYPVIGGALEFGRDPVGYLTRLTNKYGDVFTVELAGWNVHFFTNPLDVKYLEKNKLLKHGEVLYDFATRVVGEPHGIDISGHHNPTGPEVMQAVTKGMRGPIILSKFTKSFLSITTHAFEQALKTNPRFLKRDPIGLYELCGQIVFDTTFYALFGYHKSDTQRKGEKDRFYDDFMYYFQQSALLVDRISINLLPKVKRARNRLLKEMDNLDFNDRIGVSDLIQSMLKLGKDRSDEQARHLLILLWSAQANTRPALFWTLLHLLQNPNATKRILQEYDDVMKRKQKRSNKERLKKDNLLLSNWLGMSDIMKIERTDLDKMVVLDACIRETLRLAGSSMVVRKAEETGTIVVASGTRYRIRKGDYTSYFAPMTHLDHRLYERPQEYDFERHLTEQTYTEDTTADWSETSSTSSTEFSMDSHQFPDKRKAKRRYGARDYQVSSTRALLTFGCGVDRCPGRHIALIEIKIAVLIFLRYFNATLENFHQRQPPSDMRHLGFGVMPPSEDVMIRIKPRGNKNRKTHD